MNIVKNLNYFFILLGFAMYSQNINKSKIDSLTLAKNFDYFAHSYKFLDKNYKPNIDDLSYQKIRKDFKFYDKPSKSLQDSIQVILMGEFAIHISQELVLIDLLIVGKELVSTLEPKKLK